MAVELVNGGDIINLLLAQEEANNAITKSNGVYLPMSEMIKFGE